MIVEETLELITVVATDEKDVNGYTVDREIKNEVFCKVKSPGRSEFYAAMKADMKVSKIFVVSDIDYAGETQLIYDGDRYKVEKVYPAGLDEIELTCSKVEREDGTV